MYVCMYMYVCVYVCIYSYVLPLYDSQLVADGLDPERRHVIDTRYKINHKRKTRNTLSKKTSQRMPYM
jgi:hypothetical protein